MRCVYCLEPAGQHLKGCSNIERDLVRKLVSLAEHYPSELALKADSLNFTDDIIDILHTYKQLDYAEE